MNGLSRSFRREYLSLNLCVFSFCLIPGHIDWKEGKDVNLYLLLGLKRMEMDRRIKHTRKRMMNALESLARNIPATTCNSNLAHTDSLDSHPRLTHEEKVEIKLGSVSKKVDVLSVYLRPK